ncbi:hypothetical protein AMECASPLE_039249 [Ameca splendens]|uniref:Uncharacterized protein n=1 Tax=Ameca splendens TaxID=208324 RepID=A0ABV0Y8C0_9TELE
MCSMLTGSSAVSSEACFPGYVRDFLCEVLIHLNISSLQLLSLFYFQCSVGEPDYQPPQRCVVSLLSSCISGPGPGTMLQSQSGGWGSGVQIVHLLGWLVGCTQPGVIDQTR